MEIDYHKVNKQNLNNLKQICTVCLEKGEPEKLSGDSGHILLKCSKCEVCVHLRCHGEKNPYQMVKNKMGIVENLFECEKCVNKDTNSACLICKNKEGYMKKLEGKKYIHVICALFCDYFEVKDFLLMNIVNRINLKEFVNILKNKSKCDLCNESGGLFINCECSEDCEKKVHFYCAMKDRYLKLLNNSDASDFWQIEWKLENPIKNGNNIDPYSTIDNENKKNSSLLKISNVKNYHLHNRGGLIKILCELHRDPVVYCLCKKSTGSEFMLCCDNCESWFHGRCVGFSNKEVNTLKKWYCHFCTEWINNRNNFLIKEATEDYNEDLIKQACSNKWKIPVIHTHINYKVIDLIFISILYNRKANVLINNKCTHEILENHIQIGYQIPFNLNNTILPLKIKLEKFEKVKLHQDLNILNVLKNIDFNNLSLIDIIDNNQKTNSQYDLIKTYYEELEKLYSNFSDIKDSIIDENFNLIENLMKKLKWGVDAVKLISADVNNTLLSELKSLYVNYNEIFPSDSNEINKPFTYEIGIINSLLSNYSTWQKKTKEMLNDHRNRKKESEKREKELEILIKKEENSTSLKDKLNIINKRREKMEIILNSKIKMEDIIEIINTGKNLKINVEKELESIENCLKEALDWDENYKNIINNSDTTIQDIFNLFHTSENILVSSNLMYESLNLFTHYSIFETKSDYFFQNEEFLNEKQLKEIDNLILNYSLINFKDENLKQKLQNLQNIKDRINLTLLDIKNHLINVHEIIKLKSFRDSINKNLFKSEIDKFDQKIFYLQNLENLLNTENDLENLDKIQRLVHEYNIQDEKYNQIITDKKEKIIFIKNYIKNCLIEEKMPSQEECINMLNIIDNEKIQVEEKSLIKDFMKIYEWFNNINSDLENETEEVINELINEVKDLEDLMKGDIKILYEKLFYLIFKTKSNKLIQIIQTNESLDENSKIDINNLIELIDKFEFSQFNQNEFNFINDTLKNYYIIYENWNMTYQHLIKEVYEDGLRNIDNSKNLLHILIESVDNLNKLKIQEKIQKLEDIQILLEVSEKLYEILSYKKVEMNMRPNIETIKNLISECESYLTQYELKSQIKNLFYYQQIKIEIEKFDSWIEKYLQYVNYKRNNQLEKIDLSLIEILIEESKGLITNLTSEVNILKKDFEYNKNWIQTAKKIIEISDNFNNVEAIINDEELYENLKKLFNEITNNNITIGDKNLVDMIKSLEWATRALKLLKSDNSLNYRTAFRTSQEANSLKHFPEIKKKEYYTLLMNQVTLAKNIKDISEILKNHHHNTIITKQITEEQFDKIIKEFKEKCQIDLPEEKEIVENFIKFKNEIQSKFENLINIKHNLSEFEKFIQELKKFPIKLDKQIEMIETIIIDTKNIQKETKKLLDHHKSGKTILIKDKIINLYERIKINNANFSEGEILLKMFEESLDNLNKIKSTLEMKQTLNESEIYDLIGLLDEVEVHNNQEEKKIKKDLWLKKYEILIKNNLNYSVIKNLENEAKDLNIIDQEEIKENYENLINILNKAEELISELSFIKDKEELKNFRERIKEENLDLNDQLIEQEIRINMNKVIIPVKINNMIGNKRKNEEKLTPKLKKKQFVENEDEIKENVDAINDEIQTIKNIENNSLIKNETIALSRSRRNISIKLDKDYIYDKGFIDNFNINKSNAKIVTVEDYPDLITEKTSHKESDEFNKAIIPITPVIQMKPKISQREIQKKNTINQLEKILNENLILSKEGNTYINKIATELEEDLNKNYSNIVDYKKSLSNMTQTVKELEKYKKVSKLIIKGKLNIVKVSKFPYGAKYFEKLKKIEDGEIKKEKMKSQTKQNEPDIMNMLKDMNNLYSSINSNKSLNKLDKKEKELIIKSQINLNEDIEEDNDNDSLKSLSDREEIKFSPTNINYNRREEIENLSSGLNSGFNSTYNYNINNNYLTTKSSSMQSPSSPNFIIPNLKESNISNFNIDVINLGKIYDPFNVIDEEMKENKDEPLIRSMSNMSNTSKTSFKIIKKILTTPMFYDPFKKNQIVISKEKSIITNSTNQKIPPKSTLQIWQGNLQISKFIDIQNLVMCSTNNYNEFTTMTQFPQNIQINCKAKTKEVINYLEKYLINKSKTVLTGWLELENESEIENYNKLAEDYDKNERSGFVMLNEDKVYLFSLSQKYQKFYKKMKNEVKIFNTNIMNKIEKLIVFAVIKKGEYSDDINLKMIEPFLLSTNEKEEKNEQKKVTENVIEKVSESVNENVVVEEAYMSPITSEDEDENEEESEKNKLIQLLQSDNLEAIEEYVNREFANLGQDDIIEKLMSLDEVCRNKLLNLIIEYQNREGVNNENKENEEDKENVESAENFENVENVLPTNDFEMLDNQFIEENVYENGKYFNMNNFIESVDIKLEDNQYDINNYSTGNTKVNEHLSYFGFSGSGMHTDLLKGEILKSQTQTQNNQNIVNEEHLKFLNMQKMNMQKMNMQGMNNMNIQGMHNMNNNMNIPHQYPQMMNMNQAYMVNNQAGNYQMRPMMIPQGGFNQMMMQNMNPNQMNQNQMNQNQINPNQINQNQINPNQMNQNQMNQNQMNQNQMNPNQMNPNQMNPNQMNPNQMNPNQINQFNNNYQNPNPTRKTKFNKYP